MREHLGLGLRGGAEALRVLRIVAGNAHAEERARPEARHLRTAALAIGMLEEARPDAPRVQPPVAAAVARRVPAVRVPDVAVGLAGAAPTLAALHHRPVGVSQELAAAARLALAVVAYEAAEEAVERAAVGRRRLAARLFDVLRRHLRAGLGHLGRAVGPQQAGQSESSLGGRGEGVFALAQVRIPYFCG